MSSYAEGADDLEALFAEALSVGILDARDLSFTLDPAKAREKLAEFALERGDEFFLLCMAALVALGTKKFDVSLGLRTFTLGGDRAVDRKLFQDLWSLGSRGAVRAEDRACRLFGLSLLTSTRLHDAVWKIQSTDEKGAWCYSARVEDGRLQEGVIEAFLPSFSFPKRPDAFCLSVERENLGSVLGRFAFKLYSLSLNGPHGDKARLRARFFGGHGLQVWSKKSCLVDEQLSSAPRLAVLSTVPTKQEGQGRGPRFTLDRPLEITVILLDPLALPQEKTKDLAWIQWVWNGLLMDRTELRFEAKRVYFRVYLSADSLETDLSLTALVESANKKKLERLVRGLARELLDRYTRWLTEVLCGLEPGSQEHEGGRSAVWEALVARVDPFTEPNLLGSLNRALIACPLWVGWGEDGQRRWVNFREVWDVARGDGVVLEAPFSERSEEWLPACPGRALILAVSGEERGVLRRRFPSLTFRSWEREVG